MVRLCWKDLMMYGLLIASKLPSVRLPFASTSDPAKMIAVGSRRKTPT